MVAEEADAGSDAADEIVEASGFARPVETAPVTIEDNASGRVVREEEVDPAGGDERVDVLPRVVAFRVVLEVTTARSERSGCPRCGLVRVLA
ncbi:MAG TPA: hypothetical protein ENK57_13675 [Polyangiaceae bacterium]|nr:hypothetical protein [Polyangiaceae bacterium]